MFLHHLVEFGGFELNHHWHGINMLSVLECALLAACLCTLLALFAVRKSKRLTVLSLVGALSFATAAYAANTQLSLLSASGALAGANLIYVVQTAGVGGVKATMTQVATFINSLFSGDATVNSTGTVTLATVNANVGSFGSATTCTAFTTNAKGLITAASAVTCTPAVASLTGLGTGVATALGINVGTAGSVVVNGGAGGTPSSLTLTNATGLPISTGVSGLAAGIASWLAAPSSANLAAALTDETGSGAAVFGTAPTISSLNATTAMTLAFLTGGGTQCLQVSNTGAVTATGSACGSGGSGITSLTPGAGLVSSNAANCSQTALSAPGTLFAAECINAQVGTTYTFVDGDRAKLVTASNTASQAYTLPAIGVSSQFVGGWTGRLKNINTGVVVLAATTSTINGAASSVTIFPGQAIKITSDGGSPGNYTVTFESQAAVGLTTQSGANYPFAPSDYGSVVYLSNASPQIPTIAQAGTTGFPAGWYVTACNIGAGSQTITPTTSTIGGQSTKVLRAGSAQVPVCSTVISSGGNYSIVDDAQFGTLSGAVKVSAGQLSQAACADLSNGATGCSTATGTSGATIPLLNGTNTFSGAQTFGEVIGTVTTQSGTTYTLAATDCGTTVRGSNASAVTFTIPQGLPVGCNISIEQALAGAVSVNGSAVTPATLHSAHAFTKTSAQWAIISVFIETSNVAILTGDGA